MLANFLHLYNEPKANNYTVTEEVGNSFFFYIVLLKEERSMIDFFH